MSRLILFFFSPAPDWLPDLFCRLGIGDEAEEWKTRDKHRAWLLHFNISGPKGHMSFRTNFRSISNVVNGPLIASFKNYTLLEKLRSRGLPIILIWPLYVTANLNMNKNRVDNVKYLRPSMPLFFFFFFKLSIGFSSIICIFVCLTSWGPFETSLWENWRAGLFIILRTAIGAKKIAFGVGRNCQLMNFFLC